MRLVLINIMFIAGVMLALYDEHITFDTIKLLITGGAVIIWIQQIIKYINR